MKFPGNAFLFFPSSYFESEDAEGVYLDRVNLLGTTPVTIGPYSYQSNGYNEHTEKDSLELSTVLAFCVEGKADTTGFYIVNVADYPYEIDSEGNG